MAVIPLSMSILKSFVQSVFFKNLPIVFGDSMTTLMLVIPTSMVQSVENPTLFGQVFRKV